VKRRWLIGAVLLALLAASAALFEQAVHRGLVQFNSPDPKRFPVWGLDVSHHQGPVDWPQVARSPNLAFVYVKATEGGDWTDHLFLSNWQAARAAGLRVGAYHYFTFCRSAADQAAHFLATVPLEPDTLPPALDVEFGGNCANPPAPEAISAAVLDWLEQVEHVTSRRPLIYATRESREALLSDPAFAKYGVWLRDVFREPPQADGARWVIWQFANRAHVDGIEGFVDLNAIDGDLAALQRL
jgi:lysozyme